MDIISSNSAGLWRSGRLGQIKTTLFGMLGIPESCKFNVLFIFLRLQITRWFVTVTCAGTGIGWKSYVTGTTTTSYRRNTYSVWWKKNTGVCRLLFAKLYKIIIICISTRTIGNRGSSGGGRVFAGKCTRKRGIQKLHKQKESR